MMSRPVLSLVAVLAISCFVGCTSSDPAGEASAVNTGAPAVDNGPSGTASHQTPKSDATDVTTDLSAVSPLATGPAGALAVSAVDPPAVAELGPPEIPKSDDPCAQEAREILATYARLPDDMRNLTKPQVQQLHQDVDSILGRGEKYVESCKEDSQRPRVLFVVARVMSLNIQRHVIQADREMKKQGQKPEADQIMALRDAYIGRIFALLDEAALLETDENAQIELLRVRGQTLFSAGRGKEAAVIWRRLMAMRPEDDGLDQTHTGLITSLLRAATKAAREGQTADYQTIVDECDSFLRSHPLSTYLPTIVQVRGKALMHKGDMVQALAHWEQWADVIRKCAKGELYGPEEIPALENPRSQKAFQDEFHRLEEQLEFNRGFCLYAMGEWAKTEKIWAAYCKDLTARQARGELTQVGRVYLGRCDRVLRFVQSLQGKTAPNLGLDSWVGDQPIDVSEEKGNVVGLFFSPYHNPRSYPFAKALQDFSKDKWHEGFRSAMICFPKGSKPGQLELMEAERRQLGLTYPVGLDTTEQRDCYLRYHAAVGSGTIIAIDRQGKLAWYKMDPTERDILLAQGVFQRLLAEK